MTDRVNIGPGGSADLDNWFRYHAPTPEQIPLYERVRAAGRDMAQVIADLCPPGPDRSTALREVRAAVMWANAAIACAPPPESGEPETVDFEVALPKTQSARCEASSFAGSPKPSYGPGGFNRCVRARGHYDDGSSHVDEWGNRWRGEPGDGFKQIGSLDRPALLALIEAENTGVSIP